MTGCLFMIWLIGLFRFRLRFFRGQKCERCSSAFPEHGSFRSNKALAGKPLCGCFADRLTPVSKRLSRILRQTVYRQGKADCFVSRCLTIGGEYLASSLDNLLRKSAAAGKVENILGVGSGDIGSRCG